MSDNETYSWFGLFCGGSKKNLENNILMKNNWSCWVFGGKYIETREHEKKIFYEYESLCTPFYIKTNTITNNQKIINYDGCCFAYKKTEQIEEESITGESKDD